MQHILILNLQQTVDRFKELAKHRRRKLFSAGGCIFYPVVTGKESKGETPPLWKTFIFDGAKMQLNTTVCVFLKCVYCIGKVWYFSQRGQIWGFLPWKVWWGRKAWISSTFWPGYSQQPLRLPSPMWQTVAVKRRIGSKSVHFHVGESEPFGKMRILIVM